MTIDSALRTSPRRSVLHVAQPLDEGVPRCVLQLVRDQVARGFSVAVACPAESAILPEAVRLGAVHVLWKARREPGPGLGTETLQLSRIVRSCMPDVVHLHSSKAGLAGRLALRGRTPTVFQPNGWSFAAVEGVERRGAVAWERLAARWAATIVCVSEAERELGERSGIRAQWRVVSNGVDLAAFPFAPEARRAQARARLELESGPLVVCVGRLSRQKGQDVLLDAWPLVLEQVHAAKLILVGDGPEREALERRRVASVTLAGRRRDVVDWLAAADVVTLPSRWEGMPLTMLEAMACGRSVVAADVPGAGEALGAGAGAVVPVEDPDALASALVKRLEQPQLAKAEGHTGRRTAERRYDVRHTAAKMAALYDELLERDPASYMAP